MAFCDVDRGHAEIGELVGVEPDAHRIAPLAEDLDVADAGQSLQLIDDLQIGVVRQRDRIDRMIGRGQIDDENEVRVLLLDRHAALIDDRRQRRSRLRHAVLDVDRGDIERIADVEGDGDRRRAVVRARRGHVGHALDAVDLLLERRRHRVGDDLRAGAGIIGADDDLRRRDLGKLRDRQQEVADRAGEHQNRGDRRGKDRTLDEKGDHRTTAPVEIQCKISSKARRRRRRRRARGGRARRAFAPPAFGRHSRRGVAKKRAALRSLSRPAGDAARHAAEQRPQFGRLDVVGLHDRLDQPIREEFVDGRSVAERHGAPFRRWGTSSRSAGGPVALR